MSEVPTTHLNRRKPYWTVQDQQWAEEHVAASHVDALYRYGEFVVFTMLWTSNDYERGDVGRCTRCFHGDPLSVGYDQAADLDCPVCYGTSFEGGFRAQVVRPAIVSDRDPETREDRRAGEVTVERISVQTTSDIYVRTGDYMFRSDGTRYRLGQMDTEVIRSGFDHPGREQNVGGIITSATLESDRSSLSHRLPPDSFRVAEMLGQASLHPHLVVGTGRFDITRGPLIPPSDIFGQG